MFCYSHYAWEFGVVFLFCNVALDVLSSFFLLGCFTSKVNILVMAGWSVHLITLFLGRLEQAKPLIINSCT